MVVRTPEGKIKLYCKGAVSTINNSGPLSFEDRCVSLSTWPLRICQSKFAAKALFHKVLFSMFFQQDTVIFERLQDKQTYMDSTVEHLEDFAKEGK